MTYGNDKKNIPEKNDELGIKEKIFEAIKSPNPKSEDKPSKKELYLNRPKDNNFIKILYNILTIKVVTPIVRAKQLCNLKFARLWTCDSIASVKELTKFITIHGVLGAIVLTCFLVIINSDILLIQTIRGSMVLTVGIFLLGTGTGYYFFEDMLKIIKENRSK